MSYIVGESYVIQTEASEENIGNNPGHFLKIGDVVKYVSTQGPYIEVEYPVGNESIIQLVVPADIVKLIPDVGGIQTIIPE